MRNLWIAFVVLLVTACATTQEMPLAANMVRLDTRASGLLFVGSANKVTMRKAAEATIARGYTLFRLKDPTMGQGRQVVGVQTHSAGYGGLYSTPVLSPTANVGVTVVMYNEGDPGASGAFEAAKVLAK